MLRQFHCVPTSKAYYYLLYFLPNTYFRALFFPIADRKKGSIPATRCELHVVVRHTAVERAVIVIALLQGSSYDILQHQYDYDALHWHTWGIISDTRIKRLDARMPVDTLTNSDVRFR